MLVQQSQQVIAQAVGSEGESPAAGCFLQQHMNCQQCTMVYMMHPTMNEKHAKHPIMYQNAPMHQSDTPTAMSSSQRHYCIPFFLHTFHAGPPQALA
jgi:hypothetical protein